MKMNRKASASVRGRKPRLKLPCSATAAKVVKFRRPNRGLLSSRLWQCASENPEKRFHIHAQLRPGTCKSDRPFPPIFPDSNRRVYGKRECFGRRFDDGIIASAKDGDNKHRGVKPDICVIFACFPKTASLQWTFNSNNP